MDSPNPFGSETGFLNLLNSQAFSPSLGVRSSEAFSPSLGFGSSEAYSPSIFIPSQAQTTPEERRGRRNWSPTEDVVLISAWLNTSNGALIGNEQKAKAFWKRIAAYFAASPKLAGMQKREFGHCKQRWAKINDQVCKYVGCLKSATTQKSSGQNDNDVMKLANEIYLNDHGAKFTLEHCWRELRHDQKWCLASSQTNHGKSKRRKFDDRSQSATEASSCNGDEVEARPSGVKAAKGKGKRKSKVVEEEGKSLKEFQSMWEIKKKDLELKDKLNKQKLVESLLGKTEPLTEMERALKDKLINEMLIG